MKTSFKLKNFRIFDKIGTSVDIAPITFLTGCNSSGKSSAVKGLFLLNSFLSSIKKAVEDGGDIKLKDYKLDFSIAPNSTLGRFSKVINRSCKESSDLVSFEYTIHSLYIGKDVLVVMNFSHSEHDGLDNGYLHSMEMYLDDELFYRTGKKGGSVCNLSLIKDEMPKFALAELGVHTYCSAYCEYDLNGSMSREEYESLSAEAKKYIFADGNKRATEVGYHVRHSKLQCILDPKLMGDSSLEDYVNAMNETCDKQSFFVIPVVEDVLSDVSSDDVLKTACESIIKNNKDNETFQILLHKVCKDFAESQAHTFKEYFCKKELEFLANVTVSSTFGSHTEGPLVPAISQLYPKQGAYSFLLHYTSFENSKEIVGWSYRDFSEEGYRAKLKEKYEKWEQLPLSFGILYEFAMLLNHSYIIDKDLPIYYKKSEKDFDINYIHFSYQLLSRFVCNLITECLLPDWVDSLSYVGSSRVDVKRLYSLEEKNSFSTLLKRYFDGRKRLLDSHSRKINKDYVTDSFINSWIGHLDLGKTLSIAFDNEGLGVQIRLNKDDNDENRLLADEGYGVTQLVSVLLEIETAILNAIPIYNHNYYGMHNLPMLDIETKPQAVTIVLEEPEIHLHPKYQSRIAEILMDAYERFNIHFIIETHSEYLLRHTQFMVASAKYESAEELQKKCPMKVFYFPEQGTAYDMQYRTNGKFTQSFGEGFFDEADKWVMKMYELKGD